MEKLSSLPNIGPAVERQLNAVGVETPDDLRALGAGESWLRIQTIDPSACIHRLLALAGAVRGVPKANLSPDEKAALKAFYLAHRIERRKK